MAGPLDDRYMMYLLWVVLLSVASTYFYCKMIQTDDEHINKNVFRVAILVIGANLIVHTLMIQRANQISTAPFYA